MRIISKFNDYYDGAMGYGMDKTVVYDRSSAEYLPGSAEWAKIERHLEPFRGGVSNSLLSLLPQLSSSDNLEVYSRFVVFSAVKHMPEYCFHQQVTSGWITRPGRNIATALNTSSGLWRTTARVSSSAGKVPGRF